MSAAQADWDDQMQRTVSVRTDSNITNRKRETTFWERQLQAARQDERRKVLEPTEAQIQQVYETPDLIWERANGTKWIRWEDLPIVLRALAEEVT